MRSAIVSLLSCLTLAVVTTGCSSGTSKSAGNDVDVTAAAARAQQDIARYAVASAQQPVAGRSPEVAASARDTMPEAAQRVVQQYFRLIARHEYGAARDLWVEDGKASGVDDRAFAASYDRYSRYEAQVGRPGSVGAGMGQVHVAVPVHITGVVAARQQGSRGATQVRAVRADGMIMLHRVNDGIKTADAEDHLWRIRSSSVDPAMPPAYHANHNGLRPR